MPDALAQLDTRLFLFVYGADVGTFTRVALALSAIGSGWIMLGVLPLLRLPRWRGLAASLIASVCVSALAVVTLKVLFGRARPCEVLPGVHALCAAPSDRSFPSGHACGTFTVVAFVIVAAEAWGEGRSPRERLAVSAALLLVGIAIAWSRVYLGVHFPVDVTAGALLGASVGGAAGWLHLRSLRRRASAG